MLISNVSAIDNETNNDLSDEELPDTPDIVKKTVNNVTSDNIDLYFKNSKLDKKYSGETFIFKGNFENLDVLTINSNNVEIKGNNATLKNTFFNIEANNVLLDNLSFNVNKAIKNNDNAVITLREDGAVLSNLYINYDVSSNVDAYAIYADGSDEYTADNLKIINSTIYFEAHNENAEKYNCPIKLISINSLLIENNTINALLPLKNVNYGFQGATLESNFVYTIGLEYCSDFILNNNNMIASVSKRPAIEYPTLNSIMLSKCDYGVLSNNTIYLTDFITSPGVENYIYGVDIHNVNNLLIIDNNITIITTGGKLALGTAYPIQVSGPASEINITKNYMYSYSNGPNIGIYSQNFYGPTDISVTYNTINVTGLAGSHDWALVTGIESQDTNSEIMNNIIEVHSINSVSSEDNLYAISYRQLTAGDHSYNIQNNLAFTNGYYAVYLLSSKDSSIINNTLVSSNKNIDSNKDSYKEGFKNHNGDDTKDNTIIKLEDYYKTSTINVESGDSFNYNSKINGESIGWTNQNRQTTPDSNPTIPFYTNQKSKNNGNQVVNDSVKEYNDDASIQGSISEFENSEKSIDETSDNFNEKTESFDISRNYQTNSSKKTTSVGMSNNPLSSKGGESGASRSVAKKAYEIDEIIKNEEKFVPSAFLIIIAMILLIVGYRRKKIIY